MTTKGTKANADNQVAEAKTVKRAQASTARTASTRRAADSAQKTTGRGTRPAGKSAKLQHNGSANDDGHQRRGTGSKVAVTAADASRGKFEHLRESPALTLARMRQQSNDQSERPATIVPASSNQPAYLPPAKPPVTDDYDYYPELKPNETAELVTFAVLAVLVLLAFVTKIGALIGLVFYGLGCFVQRWLNKREAGDGQGR